MSAVPVCGCPARVRGETSCVTAHRTTPWRRSAHDEVEPPAVVRRHSRRHGVCQPLLGNNLPVGPHRHTGNSHPSALDEFRAAGQSPCSRAGKGVVPVSVYPLAATRSRSAAVGAQGQGQAQSSPQCQLHGLWGQCECWLAGHCCQQSPSMWPASRAQKCPGSRLQGRQQHTIAIVKIARPRRMMLPAVRPVPRACVSGVWWAGAVVGGPPAGGCVPKLPLAGKRPAHQRFPALEPRGRVSGLREAGADDGQRIHPCCPEGCGCRAFG